jgi:CubicO group peptidase (beta-lactamase class C family)
VAAATAEADEAQIVGQIVDAFAQAAIRQGVAVGIGVAVIDQSGFGFRNSYVYGKADSAAGIPFAPDSIFEIGSNTKVFTTNLVGQAVFETSVGLGDRLSEFKGELGRLEPLTGQITLRELGDFTAGIADLAPLCKDEHVPGCLPSKRPSVQDYSAQQFVEFFRGTVPKNYNLTHPKPVGKLPAPYFYSDFSTGLLGLLLGTTSGTAISDSSLDGWFGEVGARILAPLHMRNTYLEVPASVPVRRIAKGYSPAFAAVEVSDGRVGKIDLLDGGSAYSAAPAVSVIGGGGFGAKAAATIENGKVTAIKVKAGGSGYIAAPALALNGGSSTATAHAIPIVAGGKVVAVEVLTQGAGYKRVPKVTIRGGRGAGGRDATAVAHLANGRVNSITVSNGGAGYRPPLTARVAPGDPEKNVIPIWAPAGALQSTLDDVARLAAAALDRPLRRARLPLSLREGFRIAETPYACAAADPTLSTCPAGTNRVGLAWSIVPADAANHAPEIVTKNGGLPGFSSQIFLVPERGLAVVVLVNSESHGVDVEKIGGNHPLAAAPAQVLAFNIGYDLIELLPAKGTP